MQRRPLIRRLPHKLTPTSILLLTAPLRAQDAPKPAAPNPTDLYEARTVTGAGATLGYRLLKPEPYDAAKKYPLVLLMHGAGERGTDNAAQLKYGSQLFLKPEARAKFPCFVMMPQCPPEQKWADIDWTSETPKQPEKVSAPMALVLSALDGLQKEFSIDPDRLYVGGLSMGGYGTWDLITRFPDKWAAAIPICGGGDVAAAVKAKAVPVWAFHGIEDKAVKVERTREMIAALTAAGANPLYSEYPYIAHASWTVAFGEPELLPWLFAQKRSQPRCLRHDRRAARNHRRIKCPAQADAIRAVVSRSVEETTRAVGAGRGDQGACVFRRLDHARMGLAREGFPG